MGYSCETNLIHLRAVAKVQHDEIVRLREEKARVEVRVAELGGTEAAAIVYTLMESAKLAGVSPKGYLLAVVEKALKTPGAFLLPADHKATLSKS